MDNLARYELLEITQPTLDRAALQAALDAPPQRGWRWTWLSHVQPFGGTCPDKAKHEEESHDRVPQSW